MVLRLTLLLVVGSWASIAAARDLVVDNVKGNDSQNDRGLVSAPASYGPYRTINRALRGAQPGDRIILTNTGIPYRESISLQGPRLSGSPSLPFEIVGNGATIDGSIQPNIQRWIPLGNDVWKLDRPPAGFGLLLQGEAVLPKEDLGSVDLATLSPMSWGRIGPRLYMRGEENVAPFDVNVEVTELTTGITLYDVQYVIIRDVVVRGFRLDGINLHDRSRNVILENVTTTQNGRSGITVAGACHARVRDSRSALNGDSQLRVEGRGLVKIETFDMGNAADSGIKEVDFGEVIQ